MLLSVRYSEIEQRVERMVIGRGCGGGEGSAAATPRPPPGRSTSRLGRKRSDSRAGEEGGAAGRQGAELTAVEAQLLQPGG